MTLQELFTSDSSPLSEEQKKELQNEYFGEVSGLKERIRSLEQKKNELINQSNQIKASCEERVNDAIACVDSVKAMLKHSCGTHRMRDFYAEAMVGYIDDVRKDLKRTIDPLPF